MITLIDLTIQQQGHRILACFMPPFRLHALDKTLCPTLSPIEYMVLMLILNLYLGLLILIRVGQGYHYP